MLRANANTLGKRAAHYWSSEPAGRRPGEGHSGQLAFCYICLPQRRVNNRTMFDSWAREAPGDNATVLSVYFCPVATFDSTRPLWMTEADVCVAGRLNAQRGKCRVGSCRETDWIGKRSQKYSKIPTWATQKRCAFLGLRVWGIFSFFVVVSILLAFPPVQTRSIAQKAADYLSDKLGVTITIDRIAISLITRRVDFKELTVLDHHSDTLLTAGELGTHVDVLSISNSRFVAGRNQTEGRAFFACTNTRANRGDEPGFYPAPVQIGQTQGHHGQKAVQFRHTAHHAR